MFVHTLKSDILKVVGTTDSKHITLKHTIAQSHLLLYGMAPNTWIITTHKCMNLSENNSKTQPHCGKFPHNFVVTCPLSYFIHESHPMTWRCRKKSIVPTDSQP